MKRLKSLELKHKAAARMKIEGRNNDYIAAQLDVTKRSLYVWFSDDMVVEYMQNLAEHVDQEFAVKLATAGMESITALTDMLKEPNPAQGVFAGEKIKIAETILDRLPGTTRVAERGDPLEPPQLPGSSGDVNNTQIIANMSDAQLARFLNGGWREMEKLELEEQNGRANGSADKSG